MKLNYLQQPLEKWTEKLLGTEEYPRHWVTIVDIEVTLSNGFVLKVPKGEIWDGSSIPKWLWWFWKPIDKGALGDFIHDSLWVRKEEQLNFFSYNIFDCRKFADNERKKWRNYLAPKNKIKTEITHFVIRCIGGFFYSKQFKIPR